MAITRGDVTRQDVRFIRTNIATEPEQVSNKANPFAKCCIGWEVFAQSGGGDSLFNDFSAPIKFFPVIDTVTITLEKYEGGAWTTKATLTDDTYGTAFDLREKNNVKPYGYKLEWYKVLDAFGIGCYRMKFDNTVAATFSDEFTLHEYDECRVDRTVRFTTTRNSIIGGAIQTQQFDFAGLEWVDQFRLPDSIFGFKTADEVSESVRLKTGEERTYLKEFREKYSLRCDRLSIEMLRRVLYDVKQNDFMTVTDYNLDNIDRAINEIAVEVDGEFSPEYGREEPTTSLTMAFKDKFNNHRKLFS